MALDSPYAATHGKPIDERTLLVAVAALAERDEALAAIVDRHGPPPLWAREPGFATLVHIVLEQQVSLASARAAFDRLVEAIGTPSPAGFLALDDARLLAIGFSRQKTRYVRLLATAVETRALDLEGLVRLPDDAARDALLRHTGIGPWTADIYLLTALRRPDVWPDGDLALVAALTTVKRLPARPDPEAVAAITERWRPWRSVAARLLWHDYLSARARRARSPRTDSG